MISKTGTKPARLLKQNLRICSLVAVLLLLLFSGAASAFTYSSDDYSVSPTGTITPGTSVTASMTVSYSDGSSIPSQLNLDSDLVDVSWTVVKNPGSANAMTSHPTYPDDYISNFDIYESSGSVTLKVTVTGTVSSESAGESIYPLILSESGGSGTVYESPSLAVESTQDAEIATPTSDQNAGKTTSSQEVQYANAPIYFQSSPRGATVTIDGKYFGVTPCSWFSAVVGHHTVTFSKEGYLSYTEEFNITQYGSVHVTGALNPIESDTTSVIETAPTAVATTSVVSPTAAPTTRPTISSTTKPTGTPTPISTTQTTLSATAASTGTPTVLPLVQPTRSSSASKSTFDSTSLIIIISALVVIVAGTVIIVRLTKRPKKTEKTAVTRVEQKEIHVHVNGNVYSDVGVVASDNAIVNRATVTTETKKRCPNCGAELKNDDKFCSKCGKQL